MKSLFEGSFEPHYVGTRACWCTARWIHVWDFSWLLRPVLLSTRYTYHSFPFVRARRVCTSFNHVLYHVYVCHTAGGSTSGIPLVLSIHENGHNLDESVFCSAFRLSAAFKTLVKAGNKAKRAPVNQNMYRFLRSQAIIYRYRSFLIFKALFTYAVCPKKSPSPVILPSKPPDATTSCEAEWLYQIWRAQQSIALSSLRY